MDEASRSVEARSPNPSGRVGTVDAFECVERLNLDVQSLDQRRGERSDFRHVAAEQHLRHVLLPVLLQIEERAAKLHRQTIRQRLAILRSGCANRWRPVAPIEISRVQQRAVPENPERRLRDPDDNMRVHLARQRCAPQQGLGPQGAARGRHAFDDETLPRRSASDGRGCRPIRRRRTTLLVSGDGPVRRACRQSTADTVTSSSFIPSADAPWRRALDSSSASDADGRSTY